MPRAAGDKFHRVLWVTLAAVAFAFTVILTSVFIDIDDLLAKQSSPVMKHQVVTEEVINETPEAIEEDVQRFPSNEIDSDENESTFRTKRSLDSNNYVVHFKSPKMKKNLASRLATLLEQLDEEESSKASKVTNEEINEPAVLKDKKTVNSKLDVPTEEILEKKVSVGDITNKNYSKSEKEVDQTDVLHIAMHNILLQGIMEHMDLNEVYKKVQLLIKGIDANGKKDIKGIEVPKHNNSKPMAMMEMISHDSYKSEDKFLNELLNCKKLQEQISQNEDFKIAIKKDTTDDSQMLIKAIIQITNNNRINENYKNSNNNIIGVIKLIYNGKEIKLRDNSKEKDIETKPVTITNIKENKQKSIESFTGKLNTEDQVIKKSELEQVIADFLKTHSIKFRNKYNLLTQRNFITKRLKRQIKIRYLDDQAITEKSKRLKAKPKHHDDELYVEIETHFDGKGTKGEKKKKLVRTLIDKIQKAINSNVEVLEQDKTVQKKRLQVKKRTQNPIEHNELNINTIAPVEVIAERQLNPISKTSNLKQQLTSVLDKSGETWKQIYKGPGFLTASKSLNSAEMRELDIDYDSVMKNGIPKRFQKPINIETDDLMKLHKYNDARNVTLLLKDINGSGFSIGINQYMDDPPDKETLKIFTGLENLIQAYHEHYDQNEAVSDETEDQTDNITEYNHEIEKRDLNQQINKQLLAEDNIIDNREKIINNINKKIWQKRSKLNVKLFSNLKSKTKLNKFINTNAMATKKIFLKNKRNKREIDKIKLVASDRYPQTSEENVFLVSQEKIYANRAVVKEDETPEVEVGDRNEEQYDFIAPYVNPYYIDIPNPQQAYISSIYNTHPSHTHLMSKYPHIFLENISESKEEFSNINSMFHYATGSQEKQNYRKLDTETVINADNDNKLNKKNTSSTNVDEIVNAILPSRNNYKVVVKILPKNKTNIGPGYKEVHTLINKSYDKNGVRYVSSLNVSEVSKFESLNKTLEGVSTSKNNGETERQNQIKLLLRLHKERIDQELQHLKMESQKLKQMIGKETFNKNTSDFVDVLKQLGLKSFYDSNFFSLNNNKSINNINVLPISNTILPASESTTKTPLSIRKAENESINILNKIKENENITREILQKIDKNTNTLQLFLRKISDQIRSTRQAVVNTEKGFSNDSPKHLLDNKITHSFLEEFHKNFTNRVPIPFIYAFQRPINENNNKSIKTVENVLYHGHIDANKVVNDGNSNDFIKGVTNNLKLENNNNSNNIGVKGNETRFFIDELENDFKLVSNVNDRIPVIPLVKSNTTNNV